MSFWIRLHVYQDLNELQIGSISHSWNLFQKRNKEQICGMHFHSCLSYEKEEVSEFRCLIQQHSLSEPLQCAIGSVNICIVNGNKSAAPFPHRLIRHEWDMQKETKTPIKSCWLGQEPLLTCLVELGTVAQISAVVAYRMHIWKKQVCMGMDFSSGFNPLYYVVTQWQIWQAVNRQLAGHFVYTLPELSPLCHNLLEIGAD